MCNNRDHLGIRFEVWSGERTWFWRAFDSHRKGGAVGAAATEADAVREACVAIEEMSAPCLRVGINPFSKSTIIREACRESWSSRLDRVAEYLASV